jgi:hypothetical protein
MVASFIGALSVQMAMESRANLRGIKSNHAAAAGDNPRALACQYHQTGGKVSTFF